MNGKNRYEHIIVTKCEPCCDSDWCWNALKESYRKECLGPFKDLEDFRVKFGAINQGSEVSKEKRAKSLQVLIWKSKVEEYREAKMLCEHLSSGGGRNVSE